MPDQLPTTIDEVLANLEEIVETSITENNFLGIFAFVYHRVTAEIKKEVLAGGFENNPRMEAFDIAFANLYIDAFRKYKAGKTIHQSWKISFDAQQENTTILQHLLIGMNAHINLDLSVAAAQIMEGKDIQNLANDFRKVNEVLYRLTHEIQIRLGKVSRFMFLLDWIGARTDEKLIDFSMKEAREQAWRNAKILWGLEEAQRKAKIGLIDLVVMKISAFIHAPKSRLLRYVLKLIKMMEEKQVKKIIHGLREDLLEVDPDKIK